MKIHEFTVQPGQTEYNFRVEKSVQHLEVRRISTLCLLAQGLLLGLPERISVEVNHPSRRRIQPATQVLNSHIAAWAQYGRGPIREREATDAERNPDSSITAPQFVLSTNMFINDGGPLELLADDQFSVTIRNLAGAGTVYQIYLPSQPVLAANAQEFYQMDRALILEDTLVRPLPTAGFQGIVLPNDPTAIERIVIEYALDDSGRTEQNEYELSELMAAQADANPNFNVLYSSNATVFGNSAVADLLVLDFKHMRSIEIHSILGKRVEYTMFKVADRNNA